MQNLQPLSSAYGLAKHRDGRWEWAIAPGVSPSPRYQHAAVSFFCLINFYTKLFLSLINFYKSPLWSLCNACYLLFIRFLSMHDFMCREVLLEVGGWWKTPRVLQVLVLKPWSDSHFMYQVVKYLLKKCTVLPSFTETAIKWVHSFQARSSIMHRIHSVHFHFKHI